MKSSFLSPLAVSCALAFVPFSAAQFDPRVVPADSQWVVHADVRVLRESALGQRIIELLPPAELSGPEDPLRPNIAKIMETVTTATAFGIDLSGKPESMDGALLLQGSADLRKIAEGVMAQLSLSHPEQVKDVTGLPFDAYQISDQLVVAFPPEPIVLAGRSQPQLLKALEVFRRKAPALAGSSSPLVQLLPRQGRHFLVAASLVPSTQSLFQGNGPQARILQMANAASIAIGEDGDMAVARAQLVASSDQVATKLVKIVEGLTAMLSLAETNDAQLAEFINSVKIQRIDRAVTLNLSYSTERILQMIQTQRNERHGHGHGSEPVEESTPAGPAVEGELAAEWIADEKLGGDAPQPQNFRTRVIDNVALATGSIVVLAGQRNRGEHARFDSLTITPATGGGAPLRFEAEDLRLEGYRVEDIAGASGGQVIRTDEHGRARLRFPGVAGAYRLEVRYVDENDGRARFTVSVLNPSGNP
ncbi:MAG TPA: hypothetical protein VHF69_06095 [Candidatus Synoicihabitans sp.]|nr:hypothetical protein [Candidatus Synoicihabitans sp.]